MEPIAPGRVLNGKWTLGAPLGQGGGGLVFEASHRNGVRAAVKILRPELAAEPDQIARFLREGAIANHLEHIGAVAALDDDRTADGLVYVVFELLDGTSLADILQARAPLGEIEALTLTDKILDVLAAAHDKQILHRDIKPANVLVLPSGDVKLLDFGTARLSAAMPSLYTPNPTKDGAIFGTFGFMSPEQASGRTEHVDERSDLCSVAAVLFTMLTGTRLHASDETSEALRRSTCERPPPIRSVRSSVTETVARIVDRGLSIRREDRFQSARRMQGAVRFALNELRRSTQPETHNASSAAAEPIGRASPLETSGAPRRALPDTKRRISGSAIAMSFIALCVVASVAWLAAAATRAEPKSHDTVGDSGTSR